MLQPVWDKYPLAKALLELEEKSRDEESRRKASDEEVERVKRMKDAVYRSFMEDLREANKERNLLFLENEWLEKEVARAKQQKKQQPEKKWYSFLLFF